MTALLIGAAEIKQFEDHLRFVLAARPAPG